MCVSDFGVSLLHCLLSNFLFVFANEYFNKSIDVTAIFDTSLELDGRGFEGIHKPP